jgi:hypothetical protein
MPIVNIGDSKQLEFGFGDISVSAGLLKNNENMGVVVFMEQEKRPIGDYEKFKQPKEVEVSETPCRMIFTKTESIDVVIEELQRARAMMLRGTTQID